MAQRSKKVEDNISSLVDFSMQQEIRPIPSPHLEPWHSTALRPSGAAMPSTLPPLRTSGFECYDPHDHDFDLSHFCQAALLGQQHGVMVHNVAFSDGSRGILM